MLMPVLLHLLRSENGDLIRCGGVSTGGVAPTAGVRTSPMAAPRAWRQVVPLLRDAEVPLRCRAVLLLRDAFVPERRDEVAATFNRLVSFCASNLTVAQLNRLALAAATDGS